MKSSKEKRTESEFSDLRIWIRIKTSQIRNTDYITYPYVPGYQRIHDVEQSDPDMPGSPAGTGGIQVSILSSYWTRADQ